MKDPAVLFYTQDFITGTLLMTDEQRGKYIMLLCLQHQNGKLTERDMLKICGRKDEDIWDKFINEDGCFYNKRMLLETQKRNNYTESRRKNLQKTTHMDSHMEPHMENENEDVNIDDNKIDYKGVVELYHSLCPKMNKVAVINDFRKGLINARISEYGLSKVTEVIRIAGESEFLNGTNDKAWKADFEWIMRPQNFVKIMEGKYVNSVRKASDPKMSTKYIRNGKI